MAGVFLLLACGGDDEQLSDPSGVVIGEGGGGEMPLGPALVDASAPDRTTVTVSIEGDASAIASDSYVVTSDYGDLAVESVTYDSPSGRVTLTTAPQKLGVTYRLQVEGLAGEAAFVAADTAQFYAWDFYANAQISIVAERAGVGDEAVVYVQQGFSHAGAEEAIDILTDEALPVERALFTEPPDQDGNGRIVLLKLDGGGAYGGYFDPYDAYPSGQYGAASNEMELLYLNLDYLADRHVIAHELEHLLYQERHGWTIPDWPYHNEGLAECAVRAVYGTNETSLHYFMYDFQGDIGPGLPLVTWQYGNFSQYAQAYMFWSYLAGRMGGVEAFGRIFAQAGNPSSIELLLQDELGIGFSDAHRDMKLATWLRAEAGPYAFSLEVLPDVQPALAGAGGDLSLGPTAGAFVDVADAAFTPGGGHGPDIAFAGITSDGTVDFDAPYDASDVLLVWNSSMQVTSDPQPTGVVAPIPMAAAAAAAPLRHVHPPLRHPHDPGRIDRWIAAGRP